MAIANLRSTTGLETDLVDGVLRLTLNRPERRNALSRALLEEMTCTTTLIYRARDERDLIFRNELDRLTGDGITVHYVVGDRREPEYRHFLSAPHLRQLVPDIAHCDVYLCGPSGMMRPLQGTLRRIGVAKSSIHADEFAF